MTDREGVIQERLNLHSLSNETVRTSSIEECGP